MLYKSIKLLFILSIILIGNTIFAQTATVSGNISTRNGVALDQVMISTEDGFYDTVSDQSGNYTIELPIMDGEQTLIFSRNINIAEGVSFRDQLKIRKHILGITNNFSMEQKIAADVNDDGNITTFDVVRINQIMFGIDTGNIGSWDFHNTNGTFTIDNLQTDIESFDIIGIKNGNIDCH